MAQPIRFAMKSLFLKTEARPKSPFVARCDQRKELVNMAIDLCEEIFNVGQINAPTTAVGESKCQCESDLALKPALQKLFDEAEAAGWD